MTTYTEQTLDMPDSDGRSSTPTVLQPDFNSPSDIYLEDGEWTAAKSQESLWEQRNESYEVETQGQSLPSTESTVRAGRSSSQGIQGQKASSDSGPGLQDIVPVNHKSPAPVTIYSPEAMEKEVSFSYYAGTTRGTRLVINYPVTPSIRQTNIHPERYEFTHNRFTAVVCDPKGFDQLEHPFRLRLFPKPRHVTIVFVLRVTMQTTYETFFHQWNFVATAVSQGAKRLEALRASLPQDYFLPWQHTVVLVSISPSSDAIHPEIRNFMIRMGVQHHKDDIMSLLGQTFLGPTIPTDHIQRFQEHITATIHEVGYYRPTNVSLGADTHLVYRTARDHTTIRRKSALASDFRD